ncbi:MAG TPA: cytochrome c [Candidatus Acidoferrales bacterium]|jgi:ubiquinol-cytochrome c reductase cytochrome c subunit|nr:cytochrome c [Candidatus Acidoferrales bacterium]
MKAFHGYSSAAVVVFASALFFISLGARVARPAQDSKPADAPAGKAENGKRLFNKIGCYECHGREGQGSTMGGPRIAPDPIPYDALARYVRKPTGEMPPYTAKVVSDQDLADIYAFLQSRPHPPAAKNIPGLR